MIKSPLAFHDSDQINLILKSDLLKEDRKYVNDLNGVKTSDVNKLDDVKSMNYCQ